MDEFELCDDIITVSDIAAECTGLMNDLDLLISSKDLVLEGLDVESDKYKMLEASFEDSNNEVWTKIKTKIKNFLEWIKELFQKLWNKIKSEIIDIEGDWMQSHAWELKSAMTKYKPNDDDLIKIHNWNINDPGSTFIADIAYVKTTIDQLYKLGNELAIQLMVEPKRNKFTGKNTVDVKKIIISQINETWNDFCKSCGLPQEKIDNPTIIGDSDIKTAIRSKYYSKDYIDGSEKYKNIRVDNFTGKFEVLDAMYSKAGTQEIKWLCENISKRSAGSAMYLRELDEFVAKLERTAKDDPETKITIDTAKSGVITIVQNISKIALALGSEYWLIYMNLRTDMKRAARRWFDIYSRNK